MAARIRLAAVLLVSTLALACSRGGSTAQQFVERGDQYAAAGPIRRRRDRVPERASRSSRRWRPATPSLATPTRKRAKPEEAYRAYCNAIDLDPDDGHARVEAGRLLLSAGRYNEALVRAVQTLERDDQNVDAQILSGRALTKLRRYDDAIAQLDAAVAIDHRRPAYAALGDAKLAAGDADGAEAAFRAAVERAPQSVEARVALAALPRRPRAPRRSRTAAAAGGGRQPGERARQPRGRQPSMCRASRDQAAEPFFKAAAAQPNQKMKSTLALADYYSAAQRYDGCARGARSGDQRADGDRGEGSPRGDRARDRITGRRAAPDRRRAEEAADARMPWPSTRSCCSARGRPTRR